MLSLPIRSFGSARSLYIARVGLPRSIKAAVKVFPFQKSRVSEARSDRFAESKLEQENTFPNAGRKRGRLSHIYHLNKYNKYELAYS